MDWNNVCHLNFDKRFNKCTCELGHIISVTCTKIILVGMHL